MSRIKTIEKKVLAPVDRIEVVGDKNSSAKIFYNYFSKGSSSQLEVSRKKYKESEEEKLFFFSGGEEVEVSLTVGEVEELILSLQRMVDQVKK